jgi:hypothetical protein
MSEEERDYSEYDLDPSITEHEGFSVGDSVELVEDNEHDGYSAGESGVVIGFTVIPPADDPAMAIAFGNDPNGRTAIMVLMDGAQEPIEVEPTDMEVV